MPAAVPDRAALLEDFYAAIHALWTAQHNVAIHQHPLHTGWTKGALRDRVAADVALGRAMRRVERSDDMLRGDGP